MECPQFLYLTKKKLKDISYQVFICNYNKDTKIVNILVSMNINKLSEK